MFINKSFYVIILCCIGMLVYAQDVSENEDVSEENAAEIYNTVPENSEETTEPGDVLPNTSGSQFILTAEDFFKQVADKYASITDLKAQVEIGGDSVFQGVLFVKPPNKMRINFNIPIGQVISNNGEEFYVYIPQQNVALHQKKRTFGTGTGNFVTKNGLDLLRKNYLISYLDKPQFVTFDADASIQVLQLNLKWKNSSQNFRNLVLSIGRDLLIYKVNAETYNRQEVEFVFSNFELNQGIPDTRFDYDPPATAHVVEKFLFDEEMEQ